MSNEHENCFHEEYHSLKPRAGHLRYIHMHKCMSREEIDSTKYIQNLGQASVKRIASQSSNYCHREVVAVAEDTCDLGCGIVGQGLGPALGNCCAPYYFQGHARQTCWHRIPSVFAETASRRCHSKRSCFAEGWPSCGKRATAFVRSIGRSNWTR